MTTKKQQQAKPKAHKVGEVIEVAASVVRPDGVEVTVTGGPFVLMQPGTYVVDGTEMEVKKR